MEEILPIVRVSVKRPIQLWAGDIVIMLEDPSKQHHGILSVDFDVELVGVPRQINFQSRNRKSHGVFPQLLQETVIAIDRIAHDRGDILGSLSPSYRSNLGNE